jgi:hypothetical protein
MTTNGKSLPLDKIELPDAPEAERGLLGSLLLDEGAWEVLNGFNPSALTSPANRKIFTTMAGMRAAGRPIDLVTVIEELRRHGELEKVGNASYVAALTDGAPCLTGEYIRQIREVAEKRKAMALAHEALLKAMKGEVKRHAVQVPGVLASEVIPEPVHWLECGDTKRIPLGKVTIFEGDPDELKSTVTIDLVARLTSGRPMPGCTDAIEPAGAVIVSLEDGVADTIQPRLAAAGADLTRVRIIDVILGSDGLRRTPTIPDDLDAIELAIKDVSAKSLIIDPLMGTLGTATNSYVDQDIRRALAPLKDLSEKTGVATICVRHLNKGASANPKYRGGGSIGITGSARAQFLFASDPQREDIHVMAPVKGNLWRRKPPALEFTVEDHGDQPVIKWGGESIHTASSLLMVRQIETPEESNACKAAEAFLLDVLKDGPVETRELQRQARAAGLSDRTLKRAKAQMAVRAEKVGFGDGQHWEWALTKGANSTNVAPFEEAIETKPDSSTTLPKDANSENMAPFDGGELGPLRVDQPKEPANPTAQAAMKFDELLPDADEEGDVKL